MRFLPRLSLLIAATLSSRALVSTGPSAHTRESQRRVSATSSRQGAKPEALFRRNCSRCHGTDGRGQTTLGKLFNPPDFTDNEWWARHSNTRELITIITHGKKNMPAFGKKLTRSQITSLGNYMQSFKR